MKIQRGCNNAKRPMLGGGCSACEMPAMLGGGCSACEMPAMRGGNSCAAARTEGFQGCGGATQPGTYIQLGSIRTGGYKMTKKNCKLLRLWRQGKSIGFTAKSSLKAKGLIPRTSKKNKGKRIVSNKYK